MGVVANMRVRRLLRAAAVITAACGGRAAAFAPDAGMDPTADELPAAPGLTPGPRPALDPFAHVEPDTFLDSAPAAVAEDLTARFGFHANVPDARFRCTLDGERRWCSSPWEAEVATLGQHTFAVAAGIGEREDPTPARHEWRVESPYGDVALLPANDAFVDLGGGQWLLSEDPHHMAEAFYDTHPDEFDFLIVWTDFRVENMTAFGGPLKFDIAGIGLDEMLGADFSFAAGSAGHLQSLVFMHSPELWDDPILARWYDALSVLGQEVGHRWGAFLALPWEEDPLLLLCPLYNAHWNLFAGFDAPSALGIGFWQTVDNGDGTFTTRPSLPAAYGSLDLYLMGLLAPERAPGFFYVQDAYDFDPPEDPWGVPWNRDSPVYEPVRYRGERVDVSIADVVAGVGPRNPPAGRAQTRFRQAFILVHPPDRGPRLDILRRVDQIRQEWEVFFADATRGLGGVDTGLGVGE